MISLSFWTHRIHIKLHELCFKAYFNIFNFAHNSKLTLLQRVSLAGVGSLTWKGRLSKNCPRGFFSSHFRKKRPYTAPCQCQCSPREHVTQELFMNSVHHCIPTGKIRNRGTLINRKTNEFFVVSFEFMFYVDKMECVCKRYLEMAFAEPNFVFMEIYVLLLHYWKRKHIYQS